MIAVAVPFVVWFGMSIVYGILIGVIAGRLFAAKSRIRRLQERIDTLESRNDDLNRKIGIQEFEMEKLRQKIPKGRPPSQKAVEKAREGAVELYEELTHEHG